MHAKPDYISPRPKGQKPNPKNAIKKAGFILAFIDSDPPTNLTAWYDAATAAHQALIQFRSAVFEWQRTGKIDGDKLAAAYEAMEAAGLSDWLDDVLGGGE